MPNDRDFSASAQLNEMKRNPLFNRLRAQSTIDTGRYGNLQQDVINYNKMSVGRENLNKFGSDYKNLYLPGDDNIGPKVNRRMGAAMGTNSEWAMPKLHDPFEWFRERTWWFNMEDPDEQTRKIRDWARLIYTTHYLVPSMIDIYSRFPLLGMEFAHPDKRVNEFFSELFWDGLQYQDFLYELSREHWLIGDVFALGSWNDGIGAWEADELINPNDVIVAKNRALRTYQYHIKVPEEVKTLVETRQPEKEYAMLMAMFPDVVEWARKDT